MISIFLKGLLIGFAIAVPIGPNAIFCLQQSLIRGFKMGLAIGFGTALADATFGGVAGFGLTSVSSFLTSYSDWIQCLGGLFLIYLGVKIIFFFGSR